MLRPCRPRGRSTRNHQRGGAVVVLMALIMVILVAITALAIDVGYMYRVQAELQNAADAAALAGAQATLKPLIKNNSGNYHLAPKIITAASQRARQYAGYHRAGGVNLNLLDEDVVLGYQATPGSSSLTAWANGDPAPNCVQVTTRRDTRCNGSLPLFLGNVLGRPFTNQQATATAAYDANRYRTTGFDPYSTSVNPSLLPIAFNLQFWNSFLENGLSPNGTRYDNYTVTLILPKSPIQAPNNVSAGGDEIPELRGVYPDSTMPGNFGLVLLNTTSSPSSPVFSSWIRTGATAADIDSFGEDGMQATPDEPLTVSAGPGWKSSLVLDLQSVIGQPRSVPLYSSYTGTGSGGTYKIVGFGGVTIVEAKESGSNISIVFQPSIVIDGTATTTDGSDAAGDFVYPRVPFSLVR